MAKDYREIARNNSPFKKKLKTLTELDRQWREKEEHRLYLELCNSCKHPEQQQYQDHHNGDYICGICYTKLLF